MINECIYSNKQSLTVKSYKMRRLFHSSYWLALWDLKPPLLTITQYEYRMCIHMFRQRLNAKDAKILMLAWYKKNNLYSDFAALENTVIPKCQAFVKPWLKAEKHAEYLRRKARKAGDAGSTQ